MSAAASCSPSASPMAVSAHPGPLSGPVERSTALHWSCNILLACSEPRNLVRQADVHLERAPTAGATPSRRILPDPSVRDRGRVPQWEIYDRCRVTGHVGDVVAFVLWNLAIAASFCNPDSTPPQMSNATANDGDPCAGRHSQTSQDVIPSHPGLFEKPSPPPSPSRFRFFLEPGDIEVYGGFSTTRRFLRIWRATFVRG